MTEQPATYLDEAREMAGKGYEQPATDDTVFGEWVYCSQHMAAHKTGWCSVGNRDKIGLGPVANEAEAVEKCVRFGLRLYGNSDGKL